MSPPQPARGARSRACAICALLAARADCARCRRAGAARRRARPRHRHRRAADDDADRDPDDDREHHRRAGREERSTPPTPRTRSSTCRACRCASATSATTTTPCWRRAPRAAATAPARSSTPTASCSRTCSATAPSFTPRWGLVDARGDRARRRALRAVLGRLLRQLGGRGRRLRDAHADAASRRMRSCRASPRTIELYGTDDTYSGGQASASVGSRAGAFSWWIDANHLDSDAQPMSFVDQGTCRRRPGTAGTPVTGAVARPATRATRTSGYVLGATHQTRTHAGPRQGQARLRLHADAARELHASAAGATTPSAASTRSCAMPPGNVPCYERRR